MTPVATERLRYLARLNPEVPAGVRSAPARDMPYLPMEALGEDWSLRFDQSRPVSAVLAGNSYFEDGDILFAKVTPCFENGKAALVSGVPGGSAFGTTEVTVIRPSPQVESKFLFYVLVAADFQQRGRAEMTGAGGLKRVPDRTVLNYPVPLHPRDDQRAIVEYLDRETREIDAFIADQEKLIELLTERRSSVIAHAVIPARVDSAPGHQTLPLRRFGPSSESGTSVNASTMPAAPGEVGVLKTGAASSGVFLPNENKAVVLDEIHRVTAPVRQGAIILNRANTPTLVGSIAYVNQEAPDLYLSDKLWQINFARADARFVAFWAQTQAYRAQIESLAVGASSSMQNLSYGDFLGVRMPNLPRPEQEEIANRLEKATSGIEAAIADAREAITLSKERRAALISAAVTGKIDVREHGRVIA